MVGSFSPTRLAIKQLIDWNAIVGQVVSLIEPRRYAMFTQIESPARAPRFVEVLNPLTQRLLGAGIPLGPNALITIRGRKSGIDRTNPVALVEIGGKRWVIGTFGETNWVRNLRAAGEAAVTVGKRREEVRANELSASEATAFFRDVLAPYVRRIPFGRVMLGSVLGAKDILDHPKAAAERRPVFELHGLDR
jgi:deazaflavin-dependent oxidoreductase (nitroreductase family)